MKIARYPMFQAEDRVTYLASLEREKKTKKKTRQKPLNHTPPQKATKTKQQQQGVKSNAIQKEKTQKGWKL